MRYLLTIWLVFSTNQCFAKTQEIWLQDISCLMMFVQAQEVNVSRSSLVNYVCTIDDIDVVCSLSAVDSKETFDDKPSKILSYKTIGDAKHAIYVGDKHDQTIIIDFQTKKYNSSQTSIFPSGLVTKNCVGNIRLKN